MEFEEAHNNLRAIRLLYRLLHDNNLRLQYQYSDDLIERARSLLKNLLDVAVVSVFQTQLKIIATQAGISKTSFEQEKHMAVLQSNSPIAANNPPSSSKYPTCSEMTPQKDEQPQLKLMFEKEVQGSISANGGTNSQTLSSLGENSMLRHKLVKETALPNDNGISPNRKSSHYEKQHNHVDTLDVVSEHAKESPQMFEEKVLKSNEDNSIPLLSTIHEFQYNSSATGHVESSDQKDDFSDDLLNAMKRIESRMFALQLCSNPVDSTKNSADHRAMPKAANLGSANMQRQDETTGSQNHRLHTNAVSLKSNDTSKQIDTHFVSRGEQLRSQNKIQPSTQKLAMTDRVKSLNRYTHLGTQTSEGKGLRIPLNQDDLNRKPSKLSGHTNRKNLVRKNPVAWSETDQNQKKRSPEYSYTQKPVKSTASALARRPKPAPHQMVIRPTLLDQRSSEIKVLSHHNREGSVLDSRGSHKSGHVEPWKTRVQPRDHELEESSSNSYSSSSRTSQQVSANSSSCGSEDYSLPGETDGSTSGTMVDAAYEGSSEKSNNSYTSTDGNSSHSFGSLKSRRYYHKRNPEKTVGGLRRLKNKLGLIFHHHHHHHHYHHDDDDDDGSIHSNRRQRHSMWNNLHNVFKHKNKHGVITKGKVEKPRRGGAVARVPRGNQVGQFHRLVERLMRHMRHSKKPKPHKLGGVKGSRNTPRGHSKKKLHWWKMLQQRRGVKMKNGGRVKKGFISQKSTKKLT